MNNIREDLGKVGPVIAEQVEEAMLGQRTQLDTAAAERETEGVRRMLRFDRDLRERIAALHEQLQESRRDLRVSPENVQKVVEIALELAEQPALRPADLPGVWPDPTGRRKASPVFTMPPLRGSWAACSEGLEHPHTRQVRPIVFDHDIAGGRDDVVLVHLNHRLVQMALRLLRAEIWASGERRKLNRATVRIVPNDALELPAVIAHARLMLTGCDNQRLHEEIITAGGLLREGRFNRMNVGEVQRALHAADDYANMHVGADTIPKALERRLIELWPTHDQSLHQSLDVRMRDRTDGLQKQLADRAEKEQQDVTAILTELRSSILAELH